MLSKNGNPLRRKTSLELSSLSILYPKRATAWVMKAMNRRDIKGHVVRCSVHMKVSQKVMRNVLYRLGLWEVAKQIRMEHKARFRLPPRKEELK